jgi:hypothetical protein
MRAALVAALLLGVALGGRPARAADEDATELAKKTQNPVADLTGTLLDTG